MLLTALVWLEATLVFFAFGSASLRFARVVGGLPEDSIDRPVVCLLGAATVASLVSIWSLFWPVGLGLNLVFAIAAVAILSVLVRATASDSLGVRYASAILALLVLERATTAVTHYDTGFYHAQALRWLETYPAVPGLGNLAMTLAFNSSWFTVEALFSRIVSASGPMYVLAAWCFACAGSFLLVQAAERQDAKPSTVSLAAALLVPIGLLLMTKWFSSPSPDIPAALLVWVAVLLALREADRGRLFEPGQVGVAITLLASFAFTVKLSTAPVLLLPLLLIRANALGQPRYAALLLACALVVAVPFAARNLVLSGDLIYPLPFLDPFDFDWQVPEGEIVRHVAWVMSWARMPHQNPLDVLGGSPTYWLSDWFEHLKVSTKVFVFVIATIAPIYLRRVWRRLRCGVGVGQESLVYGVVLVGVGYWFAMAPDPRFGWPFVPLAASLLAARLARMVGPVATIAWRLGAAIFLLQQVVRIYTPLPGVGELSDRAWRPVAYPVPMTRTRAFGEIDIAVPVSGNQCWYAPFPCTWTLHDKLELRGDGLAQGFRVASDP